MQRVIEQQSFRPELNEMYCMVSWVFIGLPTLLWFARSHE